MAALHHMPPSPPSGSANGSACRRGFSQLAVYVSDGIYERCHRSVKLWINIYYCDDIANPSRGMSQNGNECFLLDKQG